MGARRRDPAKFSRVRTLTLAPPDVSITEHTGDAASGSLNHPTTPPYTLHRRAAAHASLAAHTHARTPPRTADCRDACHSSPGPHASRTRRPPHRTHAPRARAHPHRNAAHAASTHVHRPPAGVTRPPPPPPSRAPHHTYTHLSGAHPHTSPGTEHTARALWADTTAHTHTQRSSHPCTHTRPSTQPCVDRSPHASHTKGPCSFYHSPVMRRLAPVCALNAQTHKHDHV